MARNGDLLERYIHPKRWYYYGDKIIDKVRVLVGGEKMDEHTNGCKYGMN